MYIKKLQLLNFQVIEKFDADFNGAVYFVTGDNELGKSTLLKAIGALLTGERDAVLRDGASKGFAKMIVGDDGEEFDVQLSFTENNPRGTMTITQKSTGLKTNNISMLQRIFGYQDFDAVEFSRWSETAEGRRKQIAVVKALLPEAVQEKIAAIDTEVERLMEERTGANRDVKTFAGFVEAIGRQLEDGDVNKYAAPIDISSLMEQQQTNAQLIERAKTIRASLAMRNEQIAGIPARLEAKDAWLKDTLHKIDSEVEELRLAYERAKESAIAARKAAEDTHAEQVAAIKAEEADYKMRKANAEKWLAEYETHNPEKSSIADELEAAEAHNKKYHLVSQYKENVSQYDEIRAKADKMTERIANLREERANLIASAELPIAGLTFTEDGLELNGTPFVAGRVSDSQIMEVAAKLVIASNPKVKVFRIARGESLGAKRLQTIVDIAKKNGFQGFIEEVQRGQSELLVEEYTEISK